MPRAYTFEQPKLRAWVEKWCVGTTLNVFAGKVRLNVPEFRNDLDPATPVDLCIDAREIDKHVGDRRFESAVLDPPYTMYQAVHTYGGRKIQDISLVRNAVDRVLIAPARVISLGYNTTGMSERRGYRKLAILICNNGGSHNDILVTVEERYKVAFDGQ